MGECREGPEQKYCHLVPVHRTRNAEAGRKGNDFSYAELKRSKSLSFPSTLNFPSPSPRPPFNKSSEQADALKMFQRDKINVHVILELPSAGCWLYKTLPGADSTLPVSTAVSRPALYRVPCVALE